MSQPEKSPQESTISGENRVHRIIIRILLVLMTVEWVFLLLDQRRLALFLVTMIIATLLAPILFKKKLDMEIPAEFHLASVLFIFASLYLGEVQSFYQRLWWWDIALHTTAGLLMGILGFMLVYLLNESRMKLNMTPGFIALFAFAFAVTIGTVWEIFEFGMDQFFGLNMQKPMLGDPSGLTDTMWDIMVNAAGALIVSVIGWRYLKRKRTFFVKKWIRSFTQRNSRLFRN
ncbi:MAG: hypothetical protein WEA56_16760 [Balneolaceae bacterium]